MTDDSWKGEHFIRARVRRLGEDLRRVPEGGALISRPAAPRYCVFPGCGRTLSEKNLSGVCRAHQHEAGFYRCIQCLSLRRTREAGSEDYSSALDAMPVRSSDGHG